MFVKCHKKTTFKKTNMFCITVFLFSISALMKFTNW